MKIAVASTKTSVHWKTCEITWEHLVDRLRIPLRTGETAQEYQTMPKRQRDRAKDAAGGFVGGGLSGERRKTEFVTQRSLITLDADEAKPGAWERAAERVKWRMACYSTHSHTPEKPRLRWVIPTDRPMTAQEYPAAARMAAQWLEPETMDPTTFEVARMMYWPTCSKDGVYEFHVQEGPLVQVDQLLGQYGPGEEWKNAALWPAAAQEEPIRVPRGGKAEDPLAKEGIVGTFCRAYGVEEAIRRFLPQVYAPDRLPGRYTYLPGTTAGGAVVYEDGRFFYSHHASDPYRGRCLNSFDLVRLHKFGHLDRGEGERESYKAMCRFAREALQKDGVLPPEEFSARERREEEPWREELEVEEKTGAILPTIRNACILLRNLPQFKGKLGYNSMSDQITVRGRLPWHKGESGLNQVLRERGVALSGGKGEEEEQAWEEGDWANYYAYFEPLGFPTRQKHNGVLDNALQIVSQENSRHPIRSYLQQLRWDGVERLDTMFIRWLGAEDNRLNRVITRMWMIAGVDRVMRPGCQFDSILITCGPQGLGKTRMLRLLSKGYFTNSVDKLNVGKDTSEKLQGVWIVELGELDGMRKGELTSIKNFVTTTTDRYRGAYARQAVDHPRQCILAGTSNEGSFLRDSTGERRFWIMPVKGTGDRGELRGFREEVDQLWAEAFQRWLERMEWARTQDQTPEQAELMLYLKQPELEREMQLRQKLYKLPEEDREAVEGYLDTLRPGNWYHLTPVQRRDFAQGLWRGDPAWCTMRLDRVSTKELRCELFGERLEDAGKKTSRSLRLVSIMDSMPGWRKAGRRQIMGYPYSRVQTWVRVESKEDTGNE